MGRHQNFGEISCTERIVQGNDFALIPTVKMDIRHPVERSFGNKFPSIYNQCGVMDSWSRKTLNFFLNFFCVFWKNDTLW